MQLSRIGTTLATSPVRRGAAETPEKAADSVQLSAAARQYYDPERDKADQTKYYSTLPPKLDKLTSGEFFRKLNGLLKRTHTHECAYEPSQNLYPWVDLRPNLRLQSIYSQQPVPTNAPVHSLEDQANEWAAALAQGPTDALGIARRIAQAESKAFYNCEHAVPRIYFEDAQPMRGDLHHLFTCEQTVNSARSSRKFVDFPEFTGQSDGYAPEAQDGFEPAGGKGAVARATFYFLTRYPGKIDHYRREDLDKLLEWHHQDPPGLYEQHRNAEIAHRQGNRNPFIDHPEWADRVDFKLGLLNP